jgi:hypothetical protein
VLGTLSSYNDYDSIPVTGSDYWLTQRLRKDFGFKGYVVSDSAAVEYLYNKHAVATDMKDAVRQSILAGRCEDKLYAARRLHSAVACARKRRKGVGQDIG